MVFATGFGPDFLDHPPTDSASFYKFLEMGRVICWDLGRNTVIQFFVSFKAVFLTFYHGQSQLL